MQENNKTTDLDQNSFIEQLFKIKNELMLIISLVRKKIKIISIVGLTGAVLGFTYAYTSKPIYNAKLNFMIASKSGTNSLSAQLSGLAGFLGVENSSIGSSLYRMTELIASDKIISKALFKTIEIDGSEDFIINHLIKLEELDKSWNKSKNILMHNISYKEKINNINELSIGQRSALKIIKEMIMPESGMDGVISKSSDMKTGIIYIEANHSNETLAIELVNSVYEQLLYFYIQESYSNAQSKVDVLTKKVDSIKIELNRAQNMAGSTSDKTLGLILKEDKVDLKHKEIQEQILAIMYAEAQKNLETFKVMKDTDNPPLTLLDYPYSPITPSGKSKILFFIFGFVFSSFILLIYYRFILIYNQLIFEHFNNSKKEKDF